MGTVIENGSLIILIVSLYVMVITLKRFEDKERRVLTLEECRHRVVWHNDLNRKIDPPEKLDKIVERVTNGEIVQVDSKKVYNDIIKITTKAMKFNNLILVKPKRK